MLFSLTVSSTWPYSNFSLDFCHGKRLSLYCKLCKVTESKNYSYNYACQKCDSFSHFLSPKPRKLFWGETFETTIRSMSKARIRILRTNSCFDAPLFSCFRSQGTKSSGDFGDATLTWNVAESHTKEQNVTKIQFYPTLAYVSNQETQDTRNKNFFSLHIIALWKHACIHIATSERLR